MSNEPTRALVGNQPAILFPQHMNPSVANPCACNNSLNSPTEYSCLEMDRYFGHARPKRLVPECTAFKILRVMDRALGTEISSTPGERRTRLNSSRQALGSCIYSRTLEHRTPSKKFEGNGSASILVTFRYLTGAGPGLLLVSSSATDNIAGAASTASTLQPCSASHRARVPVPQPASSQVIPCKRTSLRHSLTIAWREAKDDFWYFCSQLPASASWKLTASCTGAEYGFSVEVTVEFAMFNSQCSTRKFRRAGQPHINVDRAPLIEHVQRPGSRPRSAALQKRIPHSAHRLTINVAAQKSIVPFPELPLHLFMQLVLKPMLER